MSVDLYIAYGVFIVFTVFAFIAGDQGRKTRKYLQANHPDALQKLSPSVAPIGFYKHVPLTFDSWRIYREVLADPVLAEDKSLVRQVSKLRTFSIIILILPLLYVVFLFLLMQG